MTAEQGTDGSQEWSNSYCFFCFCVFFLRHRRGYSPLTLSSPISGACHFDPSSHSQLETVQHGGRKRCLTQIQIHMTTQKQHELQRPAVLRNRVAMQPKSPHAQHCCVKRAVNPSRIHVLTPTPTGSLTPMFTSSRKIEKYTLTETLSPSAAPGVRLQHSQI